MSAVGGLLILCTYCILLLFWCLYLYIHSTYKALMYLQLSVFLQLLLYFVWLLCFHVHNFFFYSFSEPICC